MDHEILQDRGLESALARLEPRQSILATPLRRSPSSDMLTERELEITRKRYEYEQELEQTAQLVQRGDELLAQQFVRNTALFRMATGEVLSQNAQLMDPDHRQVVDVMTQALIDEYGVSSVENFRSGRGLLQEIASRSLRPEPPKEEPRQVTYEKKRRRIPPKARLLGYEETWEPVD